MPRRSLDGPVLVVVSYYDARPPDNLRSLLSELASVPSGWPFQVRVVVNRQLGRPLELGPLPLRAEVLVRPNAGYNIGAWEAGWRKAPSYQAYLFLQDECRLVRPGWLVPFVRAAEQSGVGLVGERLAPPWNARWSVLRRRFRGHRLPGHAVGGKPADRLDCYFDFFRRHGIEAGRKGDHLQTLVLFARREVLAAIHGFPQGADRGEAIAAEIAISKKVQAAGWTLRQVGPRPFWCFVHPQWSRTDRPSLAVRWLRRLGRAVGLPLGRGLAAENAQNEVPPGCLNAHPAEGVDRAA